MAEYIKRDFALDVVKRTSGDYAAAFAEIAHVESADVVEVVRCKDCKHHNKSNKFGWCDLHMDIENNDNFCSYGERRKENGKS